MTQFKDLFSTQALDYAKFRPTYPFELYAYLNGLTPGHEAAWDCGTGNGQAARELTRYFKKVWATDPSEKQLDQAPSHPQVEYRVASAEDSKLASQSVDLVTVAQAFHWFKHDIFFKEIQRVVKPQGVLAIWSYGIAHISPEVDPVVFKLYEEILGSYWEGERRLVEEGYRSVQVPFKELKNPTFSMTAEWSLQHLVGYLGTWSALQSYIKKNNSNPLEEIFPEIKRAWGDGAVKKVSWPLALRTFQI